MRRLIFFILFIFVGLGVRAQQDMEPHYSHFMFNRMLFNPAFTGVGTAVNANFLFRKQWVNFPGAPMNQMLNVSAPLTKYNMGVGGSLWHDQAGLQRTVNFQGNYGYHIKSGSNTFSLGLSAGIKQVTVDVDKIDAKDPDDATLYGTARSPIVADFGFGLAYTRGNFYSGLSVTHLNQAAVKFNNGAANTRLRRHYYGTIGYKYDIDPYFSLKPSVLLRYVDYGVPFQGDFNVLLDYMSGVWGGLGYRTGDAMSFMIGTQLNKLNMGINEAIKIGYAYELSVSRVPKYSAGSHEIYLAYEFKRKEKVHTPKFLKIE